MNFYQNRNLIVKGQNQNVGNLWLGDFQSARNKRSLKNDNINGVVTAGLGMKITYPSDIKHKMLPLYDAENENIYRFFSASFDFIDDCLKNGNVLIHCYAGVSRSTTILTAYLMRKNNWGYRQTLAMVKKARYVIGPNNGFIAQLRRFQREVTKSEGQQFASSTRQQTKKQVGKQNKSFVQGFSLTRRDVSLYSKNKNQISNEVGRGVAGKKIQERAKTMRKQRIEKKI